MVFTLKKNSLIALYYNARRIREVELEIAKRYKQNRMRCPVHLSVGQEAISAAFQYLVKKKDYAMSSIEVMRII